MTIHTLLAIGLGVVALIIIVALVRVLPSHREGLPKPLEVGIGFITNFFDTLGIGSFAPTTSLFKAWRLVPDERIPGTLNVGHTLPTIVEAAIYITIIRVAPVTLISLILAAVAGAWLGAGVVDATRVTAGVETGTDTDAATVGTVTVFESSVTAACASALPFKVAPVFNTIVV